MDMCYDGALVLPSSYAIMDEEEMCYIEGGEQLRLLHRQVQLELYADLALH